ncbi:MAG: hypothetical protein RLZZ336_1263, partial [Cyanobacteriota bacterium]
TIHSRPDGSLVAENAALGLVVCAMDRESLQEEARDALIRAVGPTHISYRVRLKPIPGNNNRHAAQASTIRRSKPMVTSTQAWMET